MKTIINHLFKWLIAVALLVLFFVIMTEISIKIENTASKNALYRFDAAKQFIDENKPTFKPNRPIGPWMAYYIGKSNFVFDGNTYTSSNGFLASSSSTFLLPFKKPRTIIYVDTEAINSDTYKKTTTFTKHYAFSEDSKSEKVENIILEQRKIHLWIFDTLNNQLLGHIIVFEKPLSDHYDIKKPIVNFDKRMLHKIVDGNFKNDTIYIVR